MRGARDAEDDNVTLLCQCPAGGQRLRTKALELIKRLIAGMIQHDQSMTVLEDVQRNAVAHEAHSGKAYPLASQPGDAYDNQAAYFIECLRNGEAPTLGTPQQAKLAVATANAARSSMETGRVVAL